MKLLEVSPRQFLGCGTGAAVLLAAAWRSLAGCCHGTTLRTGLATLGTCVRVNADDLRHGKTPRWRCAGLQHCALPFRLLLATVAWPFHQKAAVPGSGLDLVFLSISPFPTANAAALMSWSTLQGP